MAKKLWKRPARVSSWRKISVGMWNPPSDPTVLGFETLNVDSLLDYLDELSEASGEKVTITTFMVKVVADIFALYPHLNSIIIGNRVLMRENIDVFVQVAVNSESTDQADLSGVKLRNVDQMSFVDIARRLRSRATQVRAGQDAEIEQTKSMIDKVPPLLMPWMLRAVDFLTYVVPLELDKFGIRSDPFGSAMVTNVGQFDIRLGFAPLVPMSRCPLVLMPSAIQRLPFVEGDEIVIRRAMQCSLTIDHRAFDGYQIGQFVTQFRDRSENPYKYYPMHEILGTPEPTTEKVTKPAASPDKASSSAKKKTKPSSRTPEANSTSSTSVS